MNYRCLWQMTALYLVFLGYLHGKGSPYSGYVLRKFCLVSADRKPQSIVCDTGLISRQESLWYNRQKNLGLNTTPRFKGSQYATEVDNPLGHSRTWQYSYDNSAIMGYPGGPVTFDFRNYGQQLNQAPAGGKMLDSASFTQGKTEEKGHEGIDPTVYLKTSPVGQKMMLSEQLLPLVKKLNYGQSYDITQRLLLCENTELMLMINNPSFLKSKVEQLGTVVII